MAALNKSLLAKFSNLFKSNSLLDISKTIVCGNIVLGCLGENPDDKISYADLNKKIDAKLNDPKVTDNDLMRGLLQLDEEGISRIPLSMWAEIYESAPFKAITDKVLMQKFQNKVNSVWPYFHTTVARVDAEDVVLNAPYLRRMVQSSRLKPDVVNKSMVAIDNKVDEFTREINPDFLAAGVKGKYYGSVWSRKKDQLEQARLSDVMLYGADKGNAIADVREAAIAATRTKAEREAVTAFYMNAHDKTRLAALAAFGKSEAEYPDMFLATNVDGSDKKNKHFISKMLGTFAMSTATSMGLGVAIPLLANIPVVGNVIGPLMAGAFTAGSTIKEARKAFKIAKSENRKLTTREKVNIGINAFTNVAPYAAMLALGPAGRAVGAVVMGSKTFAMEVIRKKESLPIGQKLSGKDIATSLGTAAARSLAMYLGAKLGGRLAQGAMSMANSVVAEIQAAKTTHGEITGTAESVQNNTISQEDLSQNKNYDDYARPNLEETTGTHNDLGQHNGNNTANPEPKLSHNTITADENSLRALREHKFDLTDHARSTANPDYDRMFQLDRGANQYTQNDWYDKAGYDRAINVLHEAGVADADGALRNLAGANQFLGGEYGTELKNLLDGKLTTNTINQILKADAILDETADLIRGVEQAPVFNHDAPAFENIKVKLPDTIGELTLPEVEPVVEMVEPVIEVEPVPEVVTENIKVNLPDTVGELTLPEAEPVVETIEPIIEPKPVEVVAPTSIPLPNHDTGAAVDQFNSGNLPTREWTNDPVNILQDDTLASGQQAKLSTFAAGNNFESRGHAWENVAPGSEPAWVKQRLDAINAENQRLIDQTMQNAAQNFDVGSNL